MVILLINNNKFNNVFNLAGNILLNNCQITPSVTFGGSNSAETPESSSLVLDLLSLNNLAPYEIICYEVASADEI